MTVELIKRESRSNVLEFVILYEGRDWSYYEYEEHYSININPNELQNYEELILYVINTIPKSDVNYNSNGIELHIPCLLPDDEGYEDKAIKVKSVHFYDENGAEYFVVIR